MLKQFWISVALSLCTVSISFAQTQIELLANANLKKLNSPRKRSALAMQDSTYNPELLIPNRNSKTQKWGYIHRSSRKKIIPALFSEAGCFKNGYALATQEGENSPRQNVFKISDNGQYLKIFEDSALASDTIGEDDFHTFRFPDDFIFIHRRNRIVLIDPVNQIILDTLAPINGLPFQYFGNGNMILKYENAGVFIDHENQKRHNFPNSEYRFLAPSLWERYNPTIPTQFCDVLRLADSKIGILDRNGQLVTDFVWDTIPESLDESKNIRLRIADRSQRTYYDFTNDSLFLAFKDGISFLVHINGAILYEYPQGSEAYNPRHHYWRSQGLAIMNSPKNDSTSNFVLFDPKTGEIKLESRFKFFVLDDHKVGTWVANTDPAFGYSYIIRYFEAPSFRSIDVPGLPYDRSPSVKIPFQGKTFWIVKDLKTKNEGIIDENGETILPLWIYDLDYRFLLADQYPLLCGFAPKTNNNRMFFFSPKGQFLFHQGLKIISEPDEGEAFSFFVGPQIVNAQNSIEFRFGLSPFDVEYSNRLFYVYQYNKKGKKLGSGYIDIYGQVYF